jgi:hypothetical protein
VEVLGEVTAVGIAGATVAEVGEAAAEEDSIRLSF